jgi:hypothetical protein
MKKAHFKYLFFIIFFSVGLTFYLSFWLYEFCDEAQFDGVLGIDFFKSHIVVFDFENNVLYVRPESRTLKSYILKWIEWVYRLI